MNEPTLLDYWRVVAKRKFVIIAVVLVGTVLAGAATYLIPKTYQAEVSLFPMGGQKGGGALAMMASQSGLGGLLGAVGGGAANPSTQIMAILRSRTLAEKIIQKCDLMKVFFKDAWDENAKDWKEKNPALQPHMEDAVKALFSHVTFNDDKKTLTVVIRSVFRDPVLAARVANVYAKELSEHLRANTFTISKKNRIFVEHQLERNRSDLLDVGKQISSFYSLNKISNVIPMVDVNVSSDNDLPPEDSADLDTLQRKAEELQDKVDNIRSQIPETRPSATVQDVPQQVYLQYLTLQRELLVQINALLTQQYEMAKVEEAKEDINFQVIDWAVVPIRKFGPQRTKLTGGAMAFFLFVAVSYAFIREYLDQNSAPS